MNGCLRACISVRSAVQILGIPDIEDVNSPSESAVCHVNLDLATDEKRHRASTFHAFLPRHIVAARKANLTICSDTVVLRIHFSQADGLKPRALGVYFQTANSSSDAKTYYAGAKTEVVLCAGAIGSPHLLMLRFDFYTLHSSNLTYSPVVLVLHLIYKQSVSPF